MVRFTETESAKQPTDEAVQAFQDLASDKKLATLIVTFKKECGNVTSAKILIEKYENFHRLFTVCFNF